MPTGTKMAVISRLLTAAGLRPRPTHSETAIARTKDRITVLEAVTTSNLRSALVTVLEHVRGQRSGCWTCHLCQYRNTIILIDGPNPLGILRCASCDHVYCYLCNHSKLFRGWYVEGEDVRVCREQDDSEELPYVAVCRDCGITWRAKVKQVVKTGMGEETAIWGVGCTKCSCGCRFGVWSPWDGLRICEGEAVEGNAKQLMEMLRQAV